MSTVAQSGFYNPARASEAVPLAGIVGFFFAFRLFSVLLAVRVFGQEAQVGVAASLMLNYLLLALVIFQSLGPASRSLRSVLQLPCSGWVCFFLAFTGLSLLWTSAASLSAAAAFWAAMAADSTMVALLLRLGPTTDAVVGIMRGYVWGACFIALIAWLLPRQSDMRLGDETFLGPNQIGYLCAFAFFFALFLIRSQQGRWRWQAALLAVTLLRSLSKTTIVAFFVAQAFLLVRDRSVSRKTKRRLVFAALLVLAMFAPLLANYSNLYTNAGNSSETLTGRLGIWAYFLNDAVQQPWLGHGFHAVWKVIPPFYVDQFEARHAHNELLQQFYAYGVVGIAMFACIYASLWRKLRLMAQPSWRVLFQSMVVFVLVRGLADTEAFDLSLPMWTILMIGALIEESQRPREVPA